MEDQIKNAEIKIRVPKDTKEEFNRLTKKKAINSSEWLRQQIEQFIRDNQ